MLSDDLLCLVVGLETNDNSFGTQLVPLYLKVNLSQTTTPSTPPLLPPTHPLYVALIIFYTMSEKYSEKPANPYSRYLYDCLLVATALPYFSCKYYAVTFRHRKVM